LGSGLFCYDGTKGRYIDDRNLGWTSGKATIINRTAEVVSTKKKEEGRSILAEISLERRSVPNKRETLQHPSDVAKMA